MPCNLVQLYTCAIARTRRHKALGTAAEADIKYLNFSSRTIGETLKPKIIIHGQVLNNMNMTWICWTGTKRHYIIRTNETFKIIPHEQIEKYKRFCKMHVKSSRILGDLKKYFSSIKLVPIWNKVMVSILFDTKNSVNIRKNSATQRWNKKSAKSA